MVVKSPLNTIQIEIARLITGDEMFQMKDIDQAELIRGEVVRISPTSYKHGRIEIRIGASLDTFVRKNKLGVVFVGEVGIYTERNPDTVRGADAVFVSHQRLAQVQSESYLDVAPELIVEIISPGEAGVK